MTIFYIIGITFMVYLGVGLLLLEPTFRWLVKHRWAIDKDSKN